MKRILWLLDWLRLCVQLLPMLVVLGVSELAAWLKRRITRRPWDK